MLLKAALVSAVAGIVAASPIEERAPDPSVSIANGWVVGTATRLRNQATVTGSATAYLAIPFAASPTRFAPPQSPSAWPTAKIVQQPGPACLQQFPLGEDGNKVRRYFENPLGDPARLPESEDCLHVNVFVPPKTPRSNDPATGKTVMVWFYGGNLATGSNAVDVYDGGSLAVNHDVIVVVPNYRTNFFGFSASPGNVANEKNSGFLDQRFALEWVQNNIAAFGGSSDNVTIFGESAGAYSVKQLLAQPPTVNGKRPFRAAIMESSGFTRGSDSVGLDAWQKVVGRFCKDKPPLQSNLECLRTKDPEKIQRFISNVTNEVQFYPIEDETYTASKTLDELQSGKFADIPILIGSNLNEATVFADLAGLSNTPIRDAVRQLTGIDILSIMDKQDDLFPNLSGVQAISRIVTDLAFTCTARSFADAVVSNIGAPLWRYRYDGDFPNTRWFDGAGAYHSSEIPEVFGTYPTRENGLKGLDPTTAQITLSKYMQQAWTNFAKNPLEGPNGAAWTTFKDGRKAIRQIGVLGGPNPNGLELQDAFKTDAVCTFYIPLLKNADYAY